MNAYLYAAAVTRSQLRAAPGQPGKSWQTWDSSTTIIVPGATPDEAQARFEAFLNPPLPDGEDPVHLKIRKIAAAQFADSLLTESGRVPADWPQIVKQAESLLATAAVDDFEQGYWVDIEQVVRPENLSLSLTALPDDLPDEIRSGLNWSPGKKSLFVLSVLSPLPAAPELMEAPDPDMFEFAEASDENTAAPETISLAELYSMFPQALDKEAAVLVEARNSVVAAWLWRRHAAGTPLAANPIRIDPWCGVLAEVAS